MWRSIRTLCLIEKGNKTMIETDRLILDKAKDADWKAMYDNVWSQPECAKYMAWNVAASEEDAKARIMKTIEFQKDHDTYLVYEKASAIPIGFAGMERAAPYIYQETGICLGPNYMRRGFGKEMVQAIIQFCKQEYGAKEFLFSAREENKAAIRLAISLGFTMVSSEPKIDNRDGHRYLLLKYCLKIQSLT